LPVVIADVIYLQMETDLTTRGEMTLERPAGDILKVILAGDWLLGSELPKAEAVRPRLENTPAVRRLVFDTEKLERWDSGLLTFLVTVRNFCSRQNITFVGNGLPEGARQTSYVKTKILFSEDNQK
jgi:phospholipid/cholesterol/gamma-HCH transport system permease protein